MHTEETHAKQQVTNPAKENLIPTHTPREVIEIENLEYAVTKEIITKLSKDIVATRKRERIQPQGKGKRKLIIPESSDDDEELAATTLDIIEDVAANKVPVETQF